MAQARELDYSEPFRRAIELIGKRWTACVLRALLGSGEARFNALLMGIPGINDRVLSERLRELESAGLVQRRVDPGPPIRVTYFITERGRALVPVIRAVDLWVEEAG